jgi:hypothetical protein
MDNEIDQVSSEHSKVLTTQLPKALRLEIDKLLLASSTALILDGELAGSGTFIKCGSTYGILTAHHVIHNPHDRLRRFDFSAGSSQELGLVVIDKRNHSFTIPMPLLSCVDIGIPQDEGSGPDLSVVVLPEVRARDIAVRKSFTDISVKRAERIEQCQTPVGGWCGVGFAQCYTRPHESSTDTRRVTFIPSLTLYSQIVRNFTIDDFDYVHLNVMCPQMSEDIEPPSSFAGMSGGGIWHVRVARDPKTSGVFLDVEGTILAGVMFYQTFWENKPKELRCHAWKSIYQKVYEALSNWESQQSRDDRDPSTGSG